MVKVRFFTIADYEEEEAWLRKQHNKGLRLVDFHLPCFYVFEECTPEDVVYRIDYQNWLEDTDYRQMFKDFGWEYILNSTGFIYFRKSAAEIKSENDGEIFSDNFSKLNMLKRIIKTRMFPILISFFLCTLPGYVRMFDIWERAGDTFFTVFSVIFSAAFGFLCVLIFYCSLKLRRLRKKYERDK